MIIKIRVIVCCCILACSAQAEIYKYQDKNGKWIYSDKRPLSKTKQTVEKLKYQHRSSKTSKFEPQVYRAKQGKQYQVVVKNPLFIPVQLTFKGIGTKPLAATVVKARSSQVVYTSDHPIASYNYRWVPGEPNSDLDNYHYRFPVNSKLAHLISGHPETRP